MDDGTTGGSVTGANGSRLDGRQVEPTEPVGIRQDVDLNDLVAREPALQSPTFGRHFREARCEAFECGLPADDVRRYTEPTGAFAQARLDSSSVDSRRGRSH